MDSGYIVEKHKFLASQYKSSQNLKKMLVSTLNPLEEVFLVIKGIPNILNLAEATTVQLDLIGKIIGFNRSYCGNFSEDLNYAMETVMNRNQLALSPIEKISLSDERFRKLLEIKILKNSRKIVNYKELSSIISYFVGDYTKVYTSGEFEVSIYIPYAKGELKDYFVLLRACLPLPPTIRLRYLEMMESSATDRDILAVRTFQTINIETANMKLEEQFDIVEKANVASHAYQSLLIKTEVLELSEEFEIYERDEIAHRGIQALPIETVDLRLEEQFDIVEKANVASHAYLRSISDVNDVE